MRVGSLDRSTGDYWIEDGSLPRKSTTLSAVFARVGGRAIHFPVIMRACYFGKPGKFRILLRSNEPSTIQ